MNRTIAGGQGHATKIDFLKDIASQLIFRSARFEAFIPTDRSVVVDALTLLGSLEKVTRQSLSAYANVPAATTASDAAGASATTQASAPAGGAQYPHAERLGTSAPSIPSGTTTRPGTPARGLHYDSTKKEYQPALRDPSIIDALLRLRAGATPRRSNLIKSGQPVPAQPADTGFSALSIPEVHAEPKQNPSFRRPPAATQSVLLGARPSPNGRGPGRST